MLRRLSLAFVALLALIGGVIGSYWYGGGPADAPVHIQIAQGATLRSATNQLVANHAISAGMPFRILARIFGRHGSIKTGDYRFPPHASAAEIYDQLIGGKTVQHLVTIPEGMPAVLVQERIKSAADLTGDTPLPAEGSVLPETYSYEGGETRQALLQRMQAAMSKALASEWADRAANIIVKSPEETITLAAIVEKETAKAAERPLVAGVYSNRLRMGMKLQADPTVIYPVTKGRPLGHRILKSELAADNGYNTYLKPGLPKGPIANPGRASIHAVLHPAETKALYFVADGMGGHVFSETLEGQKANVEKWYALRRAKGEM